MKLLIFHLLNVETKVVGLIKYKGGILRRGDALANSLNCCCEPPAPCECITTPACLPSIGYYKNLRVVISGMPDVVSRTSGVQYWEISGLSQLNGTYYIPYFLYENGEYVEGSPGNLCGYWGHRFIPFTFTFTFTNINGTTTRDFIYSLRTSDFSRNTAYWADTLALITTPIIAPMTGVVSGIPQDATQYRHACEELSDYSYNTTRRTNDPLFKSNGSSSSYPLESGDPIFGSGFPILVPGNVDGILGPEPYPDGYYWMLSESGCSVATRKWEYTLSAHTETSGFTPHVFTGYSVTKEILFDA